MDRWTAGTMHQAPRSVSRGHRLPAHCRTDGCCFRSFFSQRVLAVIQPSAQSRYGRGFTIVELLVVMGIIGILISIILPVTSVIRRKARENGCSNNLRQIFHGTMLVAQEMNGTFPTPPKTGE